MRRHSFLSPKCYVSRKSKIHKCGVFAKNNIKKGELVAIWGGYILTASEVEKLPKFILEFGYPVQIHDNFYLGPKNKKDLDDSEMFNHSCDPNVGVKGQNILVARRNIKKGEEVCFDYETTDSLELVFDCKCGAKNCRKKIYGTSWENREFQNKNKGYFSYYLQEKIDKLNKK